MDERSLLYQNDQWALADTLGVAAAGDQIARIALEAQAPFTLGVTGKWGAGKTSVLRRAFATLGGQPIAQTLTLDDTPRQEITSEHWQRLCYQQRSAKLQWPNDLYQIAQRSLAIWYSPWQHQNADNPLVPLLLEIQAQFTAWQRIKQAGKTINRRGGLAGVKLIEQTIDAAISLFAGRPSRFARGMSDEVRQAWQQAEPNLVQLSDGQRFHLLFEDAVETVLASFDANNSTTKIAPLHARLIIFIDDLDRCEESVVVNLLEAIKLYLNSNRCVFILGIDDTAVMGALKRYWTDRSEEDNREYLEKLFQAVLSVPLPREPNIRTTIEQQLALHQFPKPAQLAKDITLLLEPNPRKLKNFINSLCAAWCLCQNNARKNARNIFARRLILFHYLRLYHRPIWRLLERQPWALQLLHQALHGVIDDPIPKPPRYIGQPEQRLLREIFARAFNHVLANIGDTDRPSNTLMHGNISLDQAITALEDRLDRRRSDEYFVIMFKDLVRSDMSLDEGFLHLPDIKTT